MGLSHHLALHSKPTQLMRVQLKNQSDIRYSVTCSYWCFGKGYGQRRIPFSKQRRKDQNHQQECSFHVHVCGDRVDSYSDHWKHIWLAFYDASRDASLTRYSSKYIRCFEYISDRSPSNLEVTVPLTICSCSSFLHHEFGASVLICWSFHQSICQHLELQVSKGKTTMSVRRRRTIMKGSVEAANRSERSVNSEYFKARIVNTFTQA